MTLAQLKALVARAERDGLNGGDEVKVHVVSRFEVPVDDEHPSGEAQEAERVPLDRHGRGWFECVACGANHTVRIAAYDKQRSKRA